MSSNTFGRIFKVTSFGESHGPGLGGVIDGCPPGIALSEDIIQKELDLRKPGQGPASTTRKEKDQVQLLSGVFEGVTTGTSIGFFVANQNQHSSDYEHLRHVFRPGHGDFTYQAKYGRRDHRGGGRSSGRETVSRVVGGAVAQEILRPQGIQIFAFTRELGGITAQRNDFEQAQGRTFFAPEDEVINLWEERIKQVRSEGDTLGGIVEIVVCNLPAGLGEPVFDKLDARLAYALMGVGAVKGVEIGAGFEAARMLGSVNNDSLSPQGFTSNNSGGILAGISNGDKLVVRAAIKPIPSIALKQQTIDDKSEPSTIQIGGRHDICAIPRIVPVLKSMVAISIADMFLLQKNLR